MLITFVRSIQVKAFRSDDSTWTTRIDAAYGKFHSGTPTGIPDEQGMIQLLLHEGIQNQRDGTISSFGLGKVKPGIIVNGMPHDDWGKMAPEDKYEPMACRVRADNIRSITS